MSVNAGTVLLVTTALSLDEMPPSGPVILDIIAPLVHLVQGRFLATLGHTVLGTMKNQNCVPLERTNRTTPEQVYMTV